MSADDGDRLWPRVREIALFVAGLAGVAHETISGAGERPALLTLFGVMMGLAVYMNGRHKEPK